jgi:hypothetical protein
VFVLCKITWWGKICVASFKVLEAYARIMT